MFWLEIALATIIGFAVGAVTMGLVLRSARNVVLEDQIVQALAQSSSTPPPVPPKD
jgi:hypothetical protein